MPSRGAWLNLELDLQSLFGLCASDIHSCTHWLRPRKAQPLPHAPIPKHLNFTRELLVSQDRRHLFMTPCRGDLDSLGVSDHDELEQRGFVFNKKFGGHLH
jgi:hypothetical protein